MRSRRRQFTRERLEREFLIFGLRVFFWSLAWRFTGVRYFPEIEWSDACHTHNAFRCWEWLAGRKYGVRREMDWDAEFEWLKKEKRYKLIRLKIKCYTTEARLAQVEGFIRMKWRKAMLWVPRKIHIPRLAELLAIAFTTGHLATMPMAVLAVGFETGGQDNTTGTTATVSLTLAGTQRHIISIPYYNTNTDGVTASAWNTTEALAKQQTTHPSFLVYMYLWNLYNPTSGTHDLTATAGAANLRMIGVSYTGSDTTLDASSQNTQDNTATITCSITTTSPNTIIVAGTVNNNGDANTSSDGNVRQSSSTGMAAVDKSCAASGANSVANSGTGFPGTTDWGYVIAAIKPPAVGPVNVKTWANVAAASIKTVDGLAYTSIKSIDGVT